MHNLQLYTRYISYYIYFSIYNAQSIFNVYTHSFNLMLLSW